MFKIDPLKGFWTIIHLTCGARFEITGQKIFRLGLKNFDMSLNDIERATKTLREPYEKVFQIEPPIKLIDDEEPTAIKS
jgi:hypothetical protein